MKIKKLLALVLSLVMVAGLGVVPTVAEGGNYDNEPFVFPILPGTDEWLEASNTKTSAEIARILQIPDKILLSMTTEALVETVANYPFFSPLAHNTTKSAFNIFYYQFNGFRELMARDDVSEILINKYAESKLVTDEQFAELESKIEEECFSTAFQFFRVLRLEFLIMSDMIHNGYYEGELLERFQVIAGEKARQREVSEIHSGINVFDNYAREQLALGSDMGMELFFGSPSNLPGSIWDSGSVTTPRGTRVTTFYNRRPEFSAGEMSSINAEFAIRHPNARRLRNPSIRYNCHSYAFHSQATTNRHWVNSPGDNPVQLAYITDGSFVRFNELLPRINMRAVWINSNHSGIFTRITVVSGQQVFWTTSKWGDFGLYEHMVTDSPYSGAIHFFMR